MGRVLFHSLLVACGMTSAAQEIPLNDALATARSDVKAAVAELTDLRETIASERTPLVRSVTPR